MIKKILQSPWFTAAALALAGFFLISIIKLEPALVAVNKEAANFNLKIEEARKTAGELDKQKDFLKSDAYLERQARLKLNYKKPDENAVFVYKNQYNQISNDESKKNTAPGASKNWQKWLNYLLNK